MKMKIVAGLGRLEDLERYAECGADELFCGFAPWEWLEAYGMRGPINRREALLSPVNIGSWEDMRLLARRSAAAGVDISVAFNALSYGPQQYGQLEKMICDLRAMGFARFIIADPALMLRLREQKGLQIQASGEWGDYDAHSMALLQGWGVKRYIFHRKVPISRMAACIQAASGAEYEAFVLNERCHYTGAMCHCLHGDAIGPLCRVPCEIGGVAEKRDGTWPETDGDAGQLGGSGCGLCALPELAEAGITHLKIVGRGNYARRMERDIRAVKRAIEIWQADPAGYKARMRAELYDGHCPEKCYYPG